MGSYFLVMSVHTSPLEMYQNLFLKTILLTSNYFLLTTASDQSCSGAINQVIRDPTDCSVFYKCNNDEKHKFSCPAGLVFNVDKSFCDWPDNVKCIAETTVQSSTETSVSTTQATQATSTSTTALENLITTTTTPPDSISSTSSSSSSPSTSSNLESDSECSSETSEPVTDEIISLRKSTCTRSNKIIETIEPLRPDNPKNVQIVEKILSASKFKEYFPKANKAYTYTNFLKAVGKFPSICTEVAICKKTLATIFAHFQQETAGLIYLEEIAKSNYCATWSAWVRKAYPCHPGKQYYGRGSKQLSWNYNYGAFSVAMFGKTSVLLENPELVADTWLNFASAFWFYVSPQPPKPSMQHVVDGTWQPNDEERSAGRVPGFGATIMVINGGLECGSPSDPRSLNRQKHYKQYCEMLGVPIKPEERLDCAGMGQFSASGSANPAIYWEPDQNCKLVRWQTAFTALVEGQHEECQKSSISRYAVLYFPNVHVWPFNFLF